MEKLRTDVNVAVVHDVAFTRGGGMRVVETAARQFDADLYVGMVKDSVRKQSPLEITPLFNHIVENGTLRGLYFMAQFRNVSRLREYDIVLLSGSGTHWYTPPSDQRVVWYIHAVPLSYNQKDAVAGLSRYLRSSTFSNPDAIIANSEPTRDDVRRYWNRDATIAYPPVDVDSFKTAGITSGYHLMISRLTENKGVREVVERYNDREEELLVVGDGPLLEALRRCAEPNVSLEGYVSEERKRELLAEASALILNSGNESFGIVPIEAMASATPVIAKKGGYTPRQISDGRTGLLYEDGELAAALDRFATGGVDATPEELADAAREYGTTKFRERLREAMFV